jgi:hypothetical protein
MIHGFQPNQIGYDLAIPKCRNSQILALRKIFQLEGAIGGGTLSLYEAQYDRSY